MTEDDLYQRLGVDPAAPAEVIDAAHKALLKRHHPDLAVDERDRQEREAQAKLLGEAHSILRDPTSRERYDRSRPSPTNAAPTAAPTTSAPSTSPTTRGTTGERSRTQGDHGVSDIRSTGSQPDDSSTDRRERGSRPVMDPYGRRLPEYDDIPARGRRALRVMARRDPEWFLSRRQLLARRQRIAGIPIAWFGLRGPIGDPVTLTAGRTAWSATIGAVVGSLIYSWYTTQPFRGVLSRTNLAGWAPTPLRFDVWAALTVLSATALLALAWSWWIHRYLSRYRGGVLRGALIGGVAVVLTVLAPYLLAMGVTLAVVAAVGAIIVRLVDQRRR